MILYTIILTLEYSWRDYVKHKLRVSVATVNHMVLVKVKAFKNRFMKGARVFSVLNQDVFEGQRFWLKSFKLT